MIRKKPAPHLMRGGHWFSLATNAKRLRGDHAQTRWEATMNEDVFNASLRQFLKKVGITSQREIEKAVREAVASGRLKGHEKLPAKMVLTVGGISLTHEISDEIELGR
jgi:hypothetical protein